MKKIILLGIVAISFATSCKRHRTCVCTSTTNLGAGDNITKDNYLTPKSSKKDADTWCKAQGHELIEYGVGNTSKVDCALE